MLILWFRTVSIYILEVTNKRVISHAALFLSLRSARVGIAASTQLLSWVCALVMRLFHAESPDLFGFAQLRLEFKIAALNMK